MPILPTISRLAIARLANSRVLSRLFDSNNGSIQEDEYYTDIGFHSRAALKAAKARTANLRYGIWEDN